MLDIGVGVLDSNDFRFLFFSRFRIVSFRLRVESGLEIEGDVALCCMSGEENENAVFSLSWLMISFSLGLAFWTSEAPLTIPLPALPLRSPLFLPSLFLRFRAPSLNEKWIFWGFSRYVRLAITEEEIGV